VKNDTTSICNWTIYILSESFPVTLILMVQLHIACVCTKTLISEVIYTVMYKAQTLGLHMTGFVKHLNTLHGA